LLGHPDKAGGLAGMTGFEQSDDVTPLPPGRPAIAAQADGDRVEGEEDGDSGPPRMRGWIWVRLHL